MNKEPIDNVLDVYHGLMDVSLERELDKEEKINYVAAGRIVALYFKRVERHFRDSEDSDTQGSPELEES